MMSEFWESNFKEKKAMWGYEPTDVAKSTAEFFKEKGLQEILIPGIGYGRNAKPFIKNNQNVTGIELSKTAIEIANNHFNDVVKIYHGSVAELPFNSKKYDGIFCYALLHLLDEKERLQCIKNCYNQLQPGGYMVFVSLSINDMRYGKGIEIEKNTYKTVHGVNLFFYDKFKIKQEFKDYSLLEAVEVTEPIKAIENKPSQIFWKIVCHK